MRIGEAVQLKWADVDLAGRLINIVDETGNASVLADDRRRTKNRRSRQVPIDSGLANILRRHSATNSVWVFRGPRGGRLKADTVRRNLVRHLIEPLAERFKPHNGARSFRDGRLHSFRHYYCSRLLKAGMAEAYVMKLLGHSSRDMIDLYSHLDTRETGRTIESINLLGNSSGRSAEAPNKPQEDADAGRHEAE